MSLVSLAREWRREYEETGKLSKSGEELPTGGKREAVKKWEEEVERREERLARRGARTDMRQRALLVREPSAEQACRCCCPVAIEG